MNAFVWNIFLAVTWAATTGNFSLFNLFAGFILGYLILRLFRHVMGASPYYGKVGQILGFIGFFLWQLVKANLRMAYHVVTPHSSLRPAVIGVPLEEHTDTELLILTNMISLTPGTLSLDLSDDKRTLYIHTMDLTNSESSIRDIKDGFERRLLEVMR